MNTQLSHLCIYANNYFSNFQEKEQPSTEQAISERQIEVNVMQWQTPPLSSIEHKKAALPPTLRKKQWSRDNTGQCFRVPECSRQMKESDVFKPNGLQQASGKS